MYRLLLIFTLLLPQAATANIVADDIRQQYLPSEYNAILVGEEDIPVFAGEPTTALSRGVAIIFIDAGYQGLTLQNAQQLASRLNRWGWHTRIVPSPITAPASLTTQATPDAGEETTEADMSALLHPRVWVGTTEADAGTSQTKMAMLAGAVFRDTESIPGFRLVISQGMGAVQFLALAVTENVPSPDGLVVISPYWPKTNVNQTISEQLASTLFPVLDLQLPTSTPWTRNAPQQRQVAATKAMKLHYRQKTLGPSINLASTFGDSAFSNNVSKEIYSWINYLGW